MKTAFNASLSFWVIVGLLGLAWLPLVIADGIRLTFSDLDRAYLPQAFGMMWMPFTILFSLAALLVVIAYVAKLLLVFALGRRTGRP